MKHSLSIFPILFLCALCAALPSRAQSLDAFKRQLARPAADSLGVGDARVVVCEYGEAARTVAQASLRSQKPRFRGYRVCIYMDNGQDGRDARAGALEAQKLFEETYPGIPVYPVYENPYFKVRVGNCLTSEEAIVLIGKIAATFPKAFPTHEELTLTDLLD